MRPDLLNPIFTEVRALKGVGPQLERPLDRLGLTRVVDLLFHLPTGAIERRAADRRGTIRALAHSPTSASTNGTPVCPSPTR